MQRVKWAILNIGHIESRKELLYFVFVLRQDPLASASQSPEAKGIGHHARHVANFHYNTSALTFFHIPTDFFVVFVLVWFGFSRQGFSV